MSESMPHDARLREWACVGSFWHGII